MGVRWVSDGCQTPLAKLCRSVHGCQLRQQRTQPNSPTADYSTGPGFESVGCHAQRRSHCARASLPQQTSTSTPDGDEPATLAGRTPADDPPRRDRRRRTARRRRAHSTCIEDCRKTVSDAKDLQTIQAAIDACADACEKALARIDRQRLEQKTEIASLLNMVQEALAIVSGDGQSFNRHLGHTMDRFEALTRIDDVRELKSGARARSRRASRNRRRNARKCSKARCRISITACNCSSGS